MWHVLKQGDAIVQRSLGVVVLRTRLFFFFTCWQLAPCQSTQLWISLHWRLADRPILGTNALPFPHCRLSAPFTYNIIQMQGLSIPITFLPVVSSNYPLTAGFFFFFTPTAQNVACGSSQQDRKSLSRLVASAFFLGTLIYCQCRKKWQKERGRGREVVGAEGLYKHDEQIRDLSIKQAVTTRCLANWIVPGSPERAQTILSLALLNY